MKFGDHLKQARLDRGITQKQVADDFYVTRQTISSWENETTYPDITNLIQLSNYYHISLDELLKEDSGMKEYLEKKTVTNSLKPIYRSLILACLFLSFLLVCNLLNFVQLGIFFTPILLALFFIILALNDLNTFNRSQSIHLRYTWQKYLSGDKGLKYVFILPTFCIILGIILSLKIKSIGITIIIVGIALTLAILIRKYHD